MHGDSPLKIPEHISRTIRRIFAGIGILLCLGLFLWKGTPERDMPGRTTVRRWNVVGAQETDPPAPGWFNREQDQIYVKRVGVPFLEVERKFLTSAVGIALPTCRVFWSGGAMVLARRPVALNEFMDRDGYDRGSVFPLSGTR
jgi:hypothetical protein